MLNFEVSLSETEIEIYNTWRVMDMENISWLGTPYETVQYDQVFSAYGTFDGWAYFYSFEDRMSTYEIVDGI
jgi:hypothetical protein